MTVTETLYDTELNPTHAKADLSLRVLTPTELQAAKLHRVRLYETPDLFVDYYGEA